MAEKRMVFFISELDRAEDGGYIPCIAVEGERGYHLTDWNWGDDLALANQIADERNARLGITPREAALIQLGTMRGV
jgi:hypothetical protein